MWERALIAIISIYEIQFYTTLWPECLRSYQDSPRGWRPLTVNHNGVNTITSVRTNQSFSILRSFVLSPVTTNPVSSLGIHLHYNLRTKIWIFTRQTFLVLRPDYELEVPLLGTYFLGANAAEIKFQLNFKLFKNKKKDKFYLVSTCKRFTNVCWHKSSSLTQYYVIWLFSERPANIWRN